MPHKRSRRLRFTREGKVFVALTLAIGFAAINTGNNLLHLILGMQLMLIIGSGVLSELALRGLRLKRRLPRRLFAQTPFLLATSLENTKSFLPSFSLEVQEMPNEHGEAASALVLHLPASTQRWARARLMFNQRGLQHLRAIRVATRFPFGFFEKSRWLDVEEEVLVYPAIEALSQRVLARARDGEADARRVGRRGEYHGLRNYRLGDDPRDIAWRPSARLARPLVREYEDPRARELTLVLDNEDDPSPMGNVARQEAKVRRAASLATHFIRVGYRVALVTRDLQIEGGAGEAHLDRLLRALALLQFSRRPGRALPQLPTDALWVEVSPSAEEAA